MDPEQTPTRVSALPRGVATELDGPKSDERRDTERVAFHADVELRGPTEANGTILDRNSSGLLAALDHEVRVGDIYRVAVRTPDDQVERGLGEIVWCGTIGFDYVAGIRMVEPLRGTN